MIVNELVVMGIEHTFVICHTFIGYFQCQQGALEGAVQRATCNCLGFFPSFELLKI